MRILILDSGNTSAYHVMRTLARAGHEVHLSSPEDALWSRSKYCARTHRSPAANLRPDYENFLLDVVRAVKFDLLIACGDQEAEIIWAHADEIEHHVPCLLPDRALAPIAFSKNAAYRHAASIGVPIPRTEFPRTAADLGTVHARLGSPAIVKGERGSAGSRVRRVANFDELEHAYHEISALDAAEGGTPSVQEVVEGPGFVVHALFDTGRALAICSHRKEREYPVGGGVSASATTVHERELDAAALRFLESLHWHGIAKLDFMFDRREHRFKFIEMDPRVSASIDIARAAGSDQLLMMCDLAGGRHMEPRLDYAADVHYRWLFPRDVLSVLARPRQMLGFARDFVGRRRHFDLELLDDPRMGYQAVRQLCAYVRRDIRRRRARAVAAPHAAPLRDVVATRHSHGRSSNSTDPRPHSRR
ncbi:MAG: ATP-grasp domain-containing protein [Deltaproteobacteria bacterium]|nr:ATP-grasp domain-containing protein [Deltaproteobacteria bacterium]